MGALRPYVWADGGRKAAPVLAAMARDFYAPIIPVVVELRRRGLSLRAIATELQRQGIKTRYQCRGGWSAAQVRRVLIRAEQASEDVTPTTKPHIRLWIGKKALGPYTLEQVKAWLEDGTVTLDTNYTYEWAPLQQLFGDSHAHAA
jgi:hypothetical protein